MDDQKSTTPDETAYTAPAIESRQRVEALLIRDSVVSQPLCFG
jgi:hypothetical protein